MNSKMYTGSRDLGMELVMFKERTCHLTKDYLYYVFSSKFNFSLFIFFSLFSIYF